MTIDIENPGADEAELKAALRALVFNSLAEPVADFPNFYSDAGTNPQSAALYLPVSITGQGVAGPDYGGYFSVGQSIVATVDPADDDQDYNVYAAAMAMAYVPPTNDKNISELYGNFGAVSYNGTGDVGFLTGYLTYTQAWSDITGSIYGTYVAVRAKDAGGGVIGHYVGAFPDGESPYVAAIWADIYPGVASAADEAYGLIIGAALNVPGSGFSNFYGFWSPEISLATNNYFLWLDSPGVYRVNGAGVMAYYNPTFAKYTPGAADFERVVQQWNTDILEYGPEAGGTGVKRKMKLLGSGLLVETLPTSNPSVAGQLWNDSGTVKVSAG